MYPKSILLCNGAINVHLIMTDNPMPAINNHNIYLYHSMKPNTFPNYPVIQYNTHINSNSNISNTHSSPQPMITGGSHGKTIAAAASSHHQMQPLQCAICGKSFSGKYNLQTHYRIHSGVKPYRCSICDKTFSQNHRYIPICISYMAIHGRNCVYIVRR